MNQPTKIVPIGHKFSSQLVNQKPVYEQRKQRQRKRERKRLRSYMGNCDIKWL